MAITLQLYGAFVLTLLGFILPILTILISLFPEGLKTLKAKYESEKKQSEENMTNEIKKRKTAEDIDYNAIENTIKTLKKNLKIADIKLRYLSPNKVLIKISIPLLISFFGILVSLQPFPTIYIITSLIISLLFFILGLYTIRKSILVIAEVSQAVNETKTNSSEKIIELLSTLVEKSGNNIFLDSEKINIWFNGAKLSDDKEFIFSINKKHEIPVEIINSDEKMAKNVEIGFIFPKDFLVEQTANISSIYTEENKQIIRFKKEMIQQSERNKQGNMIITFLKGGTTKVSAFIKGENIKRHSFSFKIKIVD